MFKLFIGTLNKFITLSICIFLWVQLDYLYEKFKGIIESIMITNQVSNDNIIYLWSRLFSK